MSNLLTLARIELPPLSVYTRTLARIADTEKDPLCSPLLTNLVNSQLTRKQALR